LIQGVDFPPLSWATSLITNFSVFDENN
jgi:hypothetical protein